MGKLYYSRGDINSSVPRKIMARVDMEVTYRHMKNKKVIRFIMSKSCLTNPSAFYDETTCSTDEGRAVDIIYPDVSLTCSTTTSM